MNFRNFWKLPTPPSDQIQNLLNFRHFLWRYYCKIIEIQTFLKNWDPPLGLPNSQIDIGNFRLLFLTPPPPTLGIFPKFSRFFLVMAPLSCMISGENSALSPRKFWTFSIFCDIFFCECSPNKRIKRINLIWILGRLQKKNVKISDIVQNSIYPLPPCPNNDEWKNDKSQQSIGPSLLKEIITN